MPFRLVQVFVMKLTILRLTTFSPQDHIDLAKIWPNEDIAALEKA